MASGTIVLEPGRLELDLGPALKKMTDEEFFDFCQRNRDWRIERTSKGDIVIMPPAGGETGRRNFDLAVLFGQWAHTQGSGVGFDSSTGFTLPNGAMRSPDLAWIERSRWDALNEEQPKKFPPLCPDFVVELRSQTDRLPALQEKMREYIDNGARLGWLVDPLERKVYVYRPEAPVECLEEPETVSGDPVLRGFTFELRRLWP